MIFETIAQAYENLPSGKSPNYAVNVSYQRFVREVENQFRSLPIQVYYWEHSGQPYQTSRDMFKDIRCNNRMFIFCGNSSHPYLSGFENIQFRAIHDYYGHYLNSCSFNSRGEFRAWQCHAKMFSEIALGALTTETLAQNCWFNFGPFSHLPASQRPFAEQKADLIDRNLWEPLLTLSC